MRITLQVAHVSADGSIVLENHRLEPDTSSRKAATPFGKTVVASPAIPQKPRLADAPGFEPGNVGSKGRCLTAWLRVNVN